MKRGGVVRAGEVYFFEKRGEVRRVWVELLLTCVTYPKLCKGQVTS